MQRIFIFGCSFTQYAWPTWADILKWDSLIPVFNYGLSGMGNVGISHKILEADLKHQFTEEDSIYILWTTWHREDRVIDGEWKRFGNVYNNPYYKKDFYKYCCDSDFFVKNSSAIINVNKQYKNLIKFQGHINPLNEILPDNISKNYPSLYNFYIPHLPNNHIFFSPRNRYNSFDEHPTVLDHMNFLENVINYKISKSSKKYFYNIHKKLKNLIPTFNEENYKKISSVWRENT